MDDEPRVDPGERLREARERLTALRNAATRTPTPNAASQRDAGPAGRATGTADDERVKATAERGRLVGLEIDPRALRESPGDLGRHIAEAANAAMNALRAQAQQASTEEVIDPAALVRSLQAVQEQGLREMTVMTQSINEAVARVRAGIK
ncbi:YbaB/EbfC family nucleoid-associated protein [Actinomadura barringtoniae]|uniref:YbaB/EbfC family nucleoid-associated protein n=1 Tax=Actinomadura barringtoniae TaxID=1427535 RepID=A0A939PCS0_9ACTN|nr:YbaB/EbfC family nucleoid-associated protein [Actinomadura barringtoniae]MBO2446086.1 YbaB/EbfC family nucleoid-associated protein [Actinomadura barringtoniae]